MKKNVARASVVGFVLGAMIGTLLPAPGFGTLIGGSIGAVCGTLIFGSMAYAVELHGTENQIAKESPESLRRSNRILTGGILLGATLGATIGTFIVPVIGTLLGAVVGGVVGVCASLAINEKVKHSIYVDVVPKTENQDKEAMKDESTYSSLKSGHSIQFTSIVTGSQPTNETASLVGKQQQDKPSNFSGFIRSIGSWFESLRPPRQQENMDKSPNPLSQVSNGK
jgi:uncharacterized membrane protein